VPTIDAFVEVQNSSETR